MDALADTMAISFRKSSSRVLIARGSVPGEKRESSYRVCHDVILAKPQTYMNRSGTALLELLRETEADSSDLLVIHDDLDLGLGRLRIRTKGGDGGHRGVQSVIILLQTPRFYRLRMGIGRPPAYQPADKYVLSVFLPEERPIVQEGVQRAVKALECFIKDGPSTAMNRFNV